MSRGLGQWQRLLMEGLEEFGGPPTGILLVTEYAKERLRRPLTAAEQQAVTRAAALLEARGLVRCTYLPARATDGRTLPRRLHIARPEGAPTDLTAASEPVQGVFRLIRSRLGNPAEWDGIA